MRIERQQIVDKRMSQFKYHFVTDMLGQCRDSEEAIYITCGLAHDFLEMLYTGINRNVPTQEAKAAFKIALDSFLLSHGMSVAIHEFK